MSKDAELKNTETSNEDERNGLHLYRSWFWESMKVHGSNHVATLFLFRRFLRSRMERPEDRKVERNQPFTVESQMHSRRRHLFWKHMVVRMRKTLCSLFCLGTHSLGRKDDRFLNRFRSISLSRTRIHPSESHPNWIEDRAWNRTFSSTGLNTNTKGNVSSETKERGAECFFSKLNETLTKQPGIHEYRSVQ